MSQNTTEDLLYDHVVTTAADAQISPERPNEIAMRPLVTVAIPFGRFPHPDWSIALAAMLQTAPMNAATQILRELFKKRDTARNELMRTGLKSGTRYLFFLDDDVTVPPNTLRTLIQEMERQPKDVAVLAGIYCSKEYPPQPLVFKNMGDGPYYQWKLGEVFEVEAVATGMMLIRMEAIRQIQEPWFIDVDGVEKGRRLGLVSDPELLDFKMTDDVFFCQKVRKAGFRVMAHGGVLGMHWDEKGNVYLLPDTSYPMQQEFECRWQERPRNEQEHVGRYFQLVQQYYGNVDLLPLEVGVEE